MSDKIFGTFSSDIEVPDRELDVINGHMVVTRNSLRRTTFKMTITIDIFADVAGSDQAANAIPQALEKLGFVSR